MRDHFLLKSAEMIFFIISFGITHTLHFSFLYRGSYRTRANPLYFVVPLISSLVVANVPSV
jgi:hypothetical protein